MFQRLNIILLIWMAFVSGRKKDGIGSYFDYMDSLRRQEKCSNQSEQTQTCITSQIQTQIEDNIRKDKIQLLLSFKQEVLVNTRKERIQSLQKTREQSQQSYSSDHLFKIYSPEQDVKILSQSMTNELKPRQKFDLAEINDDLRRKDVLALNKYWRSGLAKYLSYVISHWEIHRSRLSKQLLKFAHITDYNIQTFKFCKSTDFISHTFQFINFYELIYSGITFLTNKILQLFKKKTLEKLILEERIKMKIPIRFSYSNVQQKLLTTYEQKYEIVNEKIANEILLLYIKEQAQRLKGNGSNLKNMKIRTANGDSINIIQFVMKCQDFYSPFGEWNDVFIKIRGLLEMQFKRQKTIRQFDRNMYNERMVEHQCLGCSTFLHLKKNIYDETVNKIPMKCFSSVREIRLYQSQVKDCISSMMNCGGGIILFDCRLQFKNIIVQGLLMTQKQKQEYENRIYSYLNHFYPKLLPKFNVFVEFIPVVNPIGHGNRQLVAYSGQQHHIKENRCYIRRQFIQNLFVTRIKITSTDPQKVYFWYTYKEKIQGKTQVANKYCSVIEKGAVKQLSSREMVKLIKKKTLIYRDRLNLSHQELRYKGSRFSYFDHVCKDAERAKQGQFIINKRLTEQPEQINYQQKFKHLSLLYVDNQAELINIKQQLQKNNIEYHVQAQAYFSSFQATSAQKCVFLFHQKKFTELKTCLASFNSFLVHITSFIKFIKVSQAQFQYFCKLFRSEFKEYIKFYQFLSINGEKQYYFQTQSKKSTAFLYFLLKDNKSQGLSFNSSGEPIMICPLLLDKMSQQQRNRRFILIYHKQSHFCQRKSVSETTEYIDSDNQSLYSFYETNYFKCLQVSLFQPTSFP